MVNFEKSILQNLNYAFIELILPTYDDINFTYCIYTNKFVVT